MSATPRTEKAWNLCVELEARTPLRDECEKLELELAEMSKFRMDLIHEIVEDEENLKRYCAEAGVPQSSIDGDSFYTPFTSGLGELLLNKVKELASERDELREEVKSLNEAILDQENHIMELERLRRYSPGPHMGQD
jgi:hypothetical protein